jgi:4-carboxymuconolactone decarboxylase
VRVKALRTRDDVGPEQYAEVDRIIEILHHVEGPFPVMMHSPGLAVRAVELGAHLRLQSSLTPRERQMVIAAVASELECEYMWHVHTPRAITAGIPADSLEKYWSDSDTKLEPEDADISDYVLALHRTNKVPDELFKRLQASKGDRWLVEITATMGQYLLVGSVLNAFEVSADDSD